MAPLRVVFDGHHIGRNQTGNETYARGLAAALGARNGVELILGVDRQRMRDSPTGPRITVAALPSNPVGRLAMISLLARRHHADVVQTIYYLPPGRADRTMVAVHDVSYERFPEFFSRRERVKNRLLIGDAVRRAGGILTLTDHAKTEILAVYGVDPSRIHVVPCGVDPAFFHSNPVARPIGDPLRLLAVGSLQPRKNLERLVEAVRELGATRSVHLSLIGPEGFRSQEIRAAVGGVAGLEFLGYVSTARLIDAYRAADIFVYPSIYEGFGLPLIEAMASGTPVVTSTGGSIPEVAGAAAVLVDPLDPSALAAAIRRVADDEALRSELVELGQARARTYTWANAAEAAVAAYQTVLTGRS